MMQSHSKPVTETARVLVLDDDREALEEIQEILELDDVPAITAASMHEALAALDANAAVNVVVTDMHIGNADSGPATGTEFIDKARERFPGRSLSFIVLSGDAGAIGDSIARGAADFLVKPLMPDALLAAVRWALVSEDDEAEDPSAVLLRKVEETTKSLQRVSTDLAARELELSGSRENYVRRRLMGGKLRQGMADGHIVPWYQPQICVRTGQLLGFEALARWQDPAQGIQSPAEFLPLAQEIGLLGELDSLVQRAALSTLTGFHRAGLVRCDLGLNLTAGQLAEPWFVDQLCLEIERAGLEPQHVSIEVLESAMLDEAAADPIKVNVNRLSELGFGIDLDDFGTGHAGLSSLRDLDVTRIKIDRSFIQNVHQGRQAAEVHPCADRSGQDAGHLGSGRGRRDPGRIRLAGGRRLRRHAGVPYCPPDARGAGARLGDGGSTVCDHRCCRHCQLDLQ